MLILHHYPQSPVTEKVRVVLGMKGLDWRSVIIPRLPPKPLLMPLTAGYRRTPVMQVGADVFCDSLCIIRELERRYPEPSIHPKGDGGLVWAVAQWADGQLFTTVLKAIFAVTGNDMPAEFVRDRGRLYFGDESVVAGFAADLPHILAQLRAQFGWAAERLAGRPYLLGDAPTLPDALYYYLVWFMTERWDGAEAFFAQFPRLVDWAARMRAIGHGNPTDMTAEDALAEARASTPEARGGGDENDPQGLHPGDRITIAPEGASHDPAVAGNLAWADADTVAIDHGTPETGDIRIHFPRVGYRIVKS